MRTRFRAIITLALVLMASLIPAAAYASSYQTSQVDMRAHVASDGSLQVSEERTFEFTDDVNGVYWEIPLGQNQQGENVTLSINGVSVDGDEFQEVDYASSGDYGVYTVDTSGSSMTLKIFMPSSDGSSADVEISYTMNGAVMLWQDTAELYWKFVGDEWEEDSNDVTLNVSFDTSLVQQNPATVGDTLRVWGHGPLTATVTPDDEDGEVDFDVPCVRAGEFAEARIAFPTSWVPYMPSSSRSDEERLSDILDEEEQWAEEANARRERARLLSYGLAALTVVVSVALLAVTVIQKLRFKRPVPTFNETYFRDVPSDDHPAVLATFMNKGTVPDRAFVATLMKLTDDRLIKLQSVATVKKPRATTAFRWITVALPGLRTGLIVPCSNCISWVSSAREPLFRAHSNRSSDMQESIRARTPGGLITTRTGLRASWNQRILSLPTARLLWRSRLSAARLS